jgi:Protein of unknown function (DUF1449)
VFDFWLADENVIFAASGVLLVGLALLQISGITDLAPDLDSNVDGDLGSADIGDGIMSVLGIGRLPLMIWLALFLMLFTLIGFGGQQFIQSLTGALLPPLLAGPAAALAALPLTAILTRPLARIMPKDETTAVSLDSLVGRFAYVEIGTARRGSPARAKVTDVHGLAHFVMVEPDNDDQAFLAGEKLLLVRRERDLFRAISHGDHHLPQLEDKAM